MKQKHILSIAFDIPAEKAEYVSIDSKQSLADGDIVVIEPDISSFYAYWGLKYRGRPLVSGSSSFALKEAIQHWQREISHAVAAGKTVFVFLTERKQVFVDSGQRKYSGTGRNRQATRIVEDADNYQLLSLPVSLVNSSGKSIKLAPKANIVAPYWSAFADITNYRVLIEGKVSQPLLLTRDGKHIVGAVIRYGDSPGHIILLPPLDVDKESITEETEEGMQFGSELTSALIAIDKQLRAERQATPMPSWVEHREYALPREADLEVKLLQVQEKIQQLTDDKKTLQTDIKKEGELKRLLYENGTELENAIHDALRLLGFETSRFRDSDSEFDVVFKSAEGRFIGEAEGKDNKAVNIDKLRQLDMNIHEDLSREETVEPAKGVLFGNAFRLVPPTERACFFTNKCITAAKRSGIALVQTPDLFSVAQAVKSKPSKRFATACRKAIFSTSGSVVSFPLVPVDFKKAHKTIGSTVPSEGAPSDSQ